MSDINTAFCRELLKSVMVDVRKYASAEERKAAWVYCTQRHGGNNQFEFHGPGDFYWHGRADNANHAREQGWSAWLRSKGVAEYAA